MNLDLLIKLVKLANNNPSENEANLAARKVCKMIEENKFVFTNTNQTPPSNPYQRPPVYPNRGYRTDWDYGFSDLYEEVIRRQRENAERARKEREDREKRRKEEEERKKNEPKYETHERPRWNWGYNPTEEQKDFFNKGRRKYSWEEPPKNEGVERECTKCNLKVKTFNTKSPFVCSICLLNEWK